MAYRNTNPFEDEVDKFEDISDSPELARIKQETELYQQRMIDSSHRSLRLINESQGVASETGEELRKQREQLARTERNLDKMTSDLNETDRNITSLKSIWGTMSNWLKKPLKKGEPSPTEDAKQDMLKISSGIERDNNEIQGNIRKINQTTDLSWGGESYASKQPGVNDILDKNLDNMLAGLDVLKNQGLSLGKEIDDHNVLLERIQSKAETADTRVEDQNMKIRKILN